jgi:riboflavin synthase
VQDTFTVNLIPHTIAHTTLQYLSIQDAVNLEIDQIARYVERMAEWSTQQAEST